MSLGLGQLFYVLLCFINAVAVLSEDRFLAKIGWNAQSDAGFGSDQTQSIKSKMVNLISAVRTLMRSKFRLKMDSKKKRKMLKLNIFVVVPLIAINIIVIIYEIILG
ncbi:Yos1-like-domain-containing protein [Phycomyces blakesleeanus]